MRLFNYAMNAKKLPEGQIKIIIQMKWYQPDERWQMWGIKTKEEFVDKFVVPGKFHDKVPKDVVEAFETVTYLMAHAYFYYSIYDEAMSKALLIMEMSIKLKAEELGITLKLPPNKNGKVYDKKLFKIIEEVCRKEHLQFLKPEFLRAKKMRNTRMHPTKHTIYGAMGFTNGNAMLFVNVINKLFLNKNELQYCHVKCLNLEKLLSKFKQGLFVLEQYSGNYLITSIFDFKYLKIKEREILLLYVQPIIAKPKYNIENHNYEPLVIAFSQFKINGHTINGFDTNNKPISIYVNREEKNIATWQIFLEEFNNISSENLEQFHVQSSRMALWRYEELIYDNCW